MKNEISLARILLATACPGSPALWAGSFTFYGAIMLKEFVKGLALLFIMIPCFLSF
jgi:hypothetical protein